MMQQQLTREKQKIQRKTTQQPEELQLSARMPEHPYLPAQSILGNHGVLRRYGSDVVQTKLIIGSPNDKYEQEAGRIAEQVIRTSELSGLTCKEGGELVQPDTFAGRKLLAHELIYTIQQGNVVGRTEPYLQRSASFTPPRTFETELARLGDIEYPEDYTESEMNRKIVHLLRETLSSCEFPNLPRTKVEGFDGELIRRCVKYALLRTIETFGEVQARSGNIESGIVDREFHVQVSLGVLTNSWVMVTVQIDRNLNAVVRFEGISRESKGIFETGDVNSLKTLIGDVYGVSFVDDTPPFGTVTVSFSGLPGQATFTAKDWSTDELGLLKLTFRSLGSTEQSIINGATLRRINYTSWNGVKAYYDSSDNSINFLDSSLPVDMEGGWYRVNGEFVSPAVQATVHEIGHIIHSKPLPSAAATGPGASSTATTDALNEFKLVVLRNAGQTNVSSPVPASTPIPSNIPTPTQYAGKNWKEFFAESYSLYRVHPGFLQTNDYRYLYNFFSTYYP